MMESKDSFTKAAGILAIIIGLLFLAVGINYLFMPEAQKEYLQPEFWPSFAEKPISGLVQSIAFALIGFLAVGLLPVVTKLVGGEVSGFLRWIMILGIIGFAVHSIEETRSMVLTTRIADAYVDGNAATKSAITALGLQHLDPMHIYKFGLVGLWFLVANITGLTRKSLPTVLSIIGIIGGVAFWMNMVGNGFQLITLVTIAAVVAIALGPIWFIWTGIVIMKRG